MRFFSRKLAQLKNKTPETMFAENLHNPAMRVNYDSLLTEVLAFWVIIWKDFQMHCLT